MSSYINTNTTATEAAYNLGINQSNEQRNIQRLSSGLRINSAADDAAGLVISESLRAQSAGLTQATANTNDAINVVKTAEGALNEVHSLLINIRSLVVHAANVGANDPTALKADQDAIASAISSINRIAGTTQFNNKNLLDGTASSSSASVTGGTGTVNATGGNTLSIVSQAAGYGATAIASGNVTSTAATATASTATFGATPAAGTFGGNFSIEGKAVTLNGTTNTLAQIATAIQQQTGLNYAVTQAAGVVTFTSQVTGAPAGTSSFAGLTSFYGIYRRSHNRTGSRRQRLSDHQRPNERHSKRRWQNLQLHDRCPEGTLCLQRAPHSAVPWVPSARRRTKPSRARTFNSRSARMPDRPSISASAARRLARWATQAASTWAIWRRVVR